MPFGLHGLAVEPDCERPSRRAALADLVQQLVSTEEHQRIRLWLDGHMVAPGRPQPKLATKLRMIRVQIVNQCEDASILKLATTRRAVAVPMGVEEAAGLVAPKHRLLTTH